jgi:voltage-gated potassium channel
MSWRAAGTASRPTVGSRRQLPSRAWDALVTIVATGAAVLAPAILVLDIPVEGTVVLLESALAAVLAVDVVVRYRNDRDAETAGGAGRTSLGGRTAWLTIDVLAAFPVVLVAGAGTPWQLLRLLKLGRVAHFMHRWRYRAIERATLLRLVFFLYWMGLTVHWITCGWIAIRDAGDSADAWNEYLDGLYWCITTLSTVGYGDVIPETAGQKVFTISVMVMGVGIFGFIIGNIATILVSIDPARVSYLQRMEQLGAFMSYREFPADLRDRIVEYYRYLWQRRLGHDESELLSGLPPSLRTEVALFLNRDLIKRVPMFRRASDAFIREVALELTPVVLMPGDYVVRAGDKGRSMYFVSRGVLEVVSPDGETVLRALSEGDFFGEVALLSDEPRTASVRAVEYCDVHRLDRGLFERILESYPEIAAEIRATARERRPAD